MLLTSIMTPSLTRNCFIRSLSDSYTVCWGYIWECWKEATISNIMCSVCPAYLQTSWEFCRRRWLGVIFLDSTGYCGCPAELCIDPWEVVHNEYVDKCMTVPQGRIVTLQCRWSLNKSSFNSFKRVLAIHPWDCPQLVGESFPRPSDSWWDNLNPRKKGKCLSLKTHVLGLPSYEVKHTME